MDKFRAVRGVPNMFGRQNGSQKQETSAFDVPDSVIRSLWELGKFNLKLVWKTSKIYDSRFVLQERVAFQNRLFD
jgi:hypothetical protein